MWLRKRWLRFKLKRLEQKYREQDQWKATPSLLLELMFTFKQSDLGRYTSEYGRRLEVSTGFTDAEHVIRVIRRVGEQLKTFDFIDDEDAGLYKRPITKTLDEFLITTNGDVVDIKEFHHVLLSVIVDFVVYFNGAQQDPDRKGYYARRVGGLCKDLFTIVEALLIAATSLEPSTW